MDRRLEYCKAMAKYIEENAKSIFAASYNIDAYNTAKQCLEWRDAFVMSEKPSLEARENIWRTTLMGTEDISKLAKEFDFSGGEIDNIVRKCEMNEIIKGTQPDYEEIVELCKTERLENAEEHRMDFCG